MNIVRAQFSSRESRPNPVGPQNFCSSRYDLHRRHRHAAVLTCFGAYLIGKQLRTYLPRSFVFWPARAGRRNFDLTLIRVIRRFHCRRLLLSPSLVTYLSIFPVLTSPFRRLFHRPRSTVSILEIGAYTFALCQSSLKSKTSSRTAITCASLCRLHAVTNVGDRKYYV